MDRTLDIALFYDPPKIDELKSLSITDFDVCLICTQANATVEQAFSSGYVQVDWGTQFNIKHAKLFPDSPAPILHTTMSRIALEFMLKHGGAAYLAAPMAKKEPTKELHQVANAPVFKRDVFATMRKDSDRKEMLTEVMQWLLVPTQGNNATYKVDTQELK